MSFKKIILIIGIAALFLHSGVIAQAEDTESAQLASNEAVVTTFDELKKAISEDNGIDTVYLGADISLSGGIKIADSKKSFTLSGKDPVTNEIHTLTETMSSSILQSSVITVNSNSGTKETTLIDINVFGKNYYGTISVLSAAKNVVQNYENVNYQGPQLIYNLNGTASFSGNNNIKIASVVSGSASPNEVGEMKGLTVSGKLNIEHEGGSNNDSAFWFGSGTADVNTFTVKENADVKVLTTANGMFYRSGSKPIDINVEKNAKLDIISGNNIFRDTAGGAINIDEGADVSMTKTAGSGTYLWLSGNLTVNPDARFVLKRTGGSGELVYFSNSAAKLDIRNPRSFLMATEPDSTMLVWPYTSTFSFEAQMVNYWDTVGPVDRKEAPKQSFYLSNTENVTGSLTFTGKTTNILSTNAGMTAANFNQYTARMIAMGRLEGKLNPVTDGDATVSGTATKDAYTKILYAEDSVAQQLNGQADANGHFEIPIPNGFIKPYTELTTTISQDQREINLEKVTVTDVTPPNGTPVQQILNVGDVFPEVSQLVTDIYDHSDNTVGSGVTATIISTPDMDVFGPTQAVVRLKDKANNYVEIVVPVFIKDDATVIQDNTALRAVDFAVHLDEISSLDEENLKQLIIDKAEANAYDVETGVDLTSGITVSGTDLKKEVGEYKATLQIGTLTKEVTIRVTGELKFNQVPENFSFETIELAKQKNIAKRTPDFAMSVLDSRGVGSKFRVTASIQTPLTSTTNSAHILPEGLIFVDNTGEKRILSAEETTVFQTQTTSEMNVPVQWGENQGILVEADAAETYTDENYEATIEWTLTDAP
ncbi:hypothetical protein C1909_00735 [Listeria ivanovii]|uniref:hypothetical protein n=1 Tax=Listeria ivanovii TaxID=1638 RepID=UPI000DAA26E6|nr:hypothetical protein [Listeria ivanovii]PZG54708.1 hypothetical protein C1909_00735 [Listeria ivanovii]